MFDSTWFAYIPTCWFLISFFACAVQCSETNKYRNSEGKLGRFYPKLISIVEFDSITARFGNGIRPFKTNPSPYARSDPREFRKLWSSFGFKRQSDTLYIRSWRNTYCLNQLCDVHGNVWRGLHTTINLKIAKSSWVVVGEKNKEEKRIDRGSDPKMHYESNIVVKIVKLEFRIFGS